VKDFLLKLPNAHTYRWLLATAVKQCGVLQVFAATELNFLFKAFLPGRMQGGFCNQGSKFIVERKIGFLLAIVVMTK
ncbi:hypothetical protein, partial [Pantoea agglomerans]|uniref:hypothetical protein n=1 Tax=Enterobacter agglomerans TaxID=549 RepID=UPI001D0BFD5D